MHRGKIYKALQIICSFISKEVPVYPGNTECNSGSHTEWDSSPHTHSHTHLWLFVLANLSMFLACFVGIGREPRGNSHGDHEKFHTDSNPSSRSYETATLLSLLICMHASNTD